VTSKNKNKKNNNKEYKTHEGEEWFEKEKAKGDFCEEDMFRS
jgi:hypothetical protein